MQTLTVPINQQDINYAHSYSSQSTKFNHENFFIGKLGERVVIRYLRELNISLWDDWTEVNRADQYDMATQGDIFDIKTSINSRTDSLLVPKDAFDRGRKFSFYIAVRLGKDMKTATIKGYAATRDIESAKVINISPQRVCYSIPYSSLRPFNELVDYLKKSK